MSQPEQPTGQLHIFFGSAPGVGKTWAMVDAAQQKRLQGVEVVAAHVDTHDRPEFAALLGNLEIIPPQVIDFNGVQLAELDLDAILRRKPEIVLIDDLAHSNVPGAHHAKRYQDVIEILQAGIGVFTTLNVQHVSSVAEAVEELTGIHVREQVPDMVLEMATSIRLIDLAPDELLRRLTQRLNAPEPDQIELGDLFKPSTLVTLRELALRLAASRVDEDVRKLAAPNHQVEPWLTSSKIMVGISASPNNERLLRATRRLVSEMRTTWLAVYVQTPQEARLPKEERERVQEHLQLARELGAETLTVAGKDTAEQLVEVARQYNVSRIVVGRSKHPAPMSLVRSRPSLADELIRLSETLDVIILSG